jgi:hypothetical protein
MLRIERVSTPEQLVAARAIFREYADGIAPFAARSLELQGFEAELATLPGKYAEPDGRILLAMDGERVVGCIASGVVVVAESG